MMKVFKYSTVAMLFASANAFAHHPAVDMVDPDVYSMIEENISDMHLSLTFDDMGSDTAPGGSDIDAAGNGGDMNVGDMADAAEMGSDMADAGSLVAERESMGAMADIDPVGSAQAGRP